MLIYYLFFLYNCVTASRFFVSPTEEAVRSLFTSTNLTEKEHEAMTRSQLCFARMIRLMDESIDFKAEIYEELMENGIPVLADVLSNGKLIELAGKRFQLGDNLLVLANMLKDRSNISGVPLSDGIGSLLKSFHKSDIQDGIVMFCALFRESVINFKISNFFPFDLSSIFSTEDMPQFIVENISRFISLYFDEIGFYVKKNFFAALLETPLNSKHEVFLQNVLMEVGPGLGKIFQIFADKVRNDEIRSILMRFKSEIKPMNEKALKQQMYETFHPDGWEVRLASFEWKSTTAATIGQGHLGSLLKDDNQEMPVFCKVMRYNIEKIIAEEKEVAKKIYLANPSARNYFQDIISSWYAEIDWTREVENTRIAAKIYRKRSVSSLVKVDTCEIVAHFPDRNPQFLAMRLAPGKSLSYHLENMEKLSVNKVKGIAKFLEYLLDVWYKEIAQKSGYYHGDLHAGNILYEISEEEEKSIATLIDFGNFESVPRKTFQDFFLVVLSISLGNYREACKQLGMRKAQHNLPVWIKFTSDLENSFSIEQMRSFESIDCFVRRVIDVIGRHPCLPIPGSLTNFLRAKILIESNLEVFRKNNPYAHLCKIKSPSDIYIKYVPKLKAIHKMFKALKRSFSDSTIGPFVQRARAIHEM